MQSSSLSRILRSSQCKFCDNIYILTTKDKFPKAYLKNIWKAMKSITKQQRVRRFVNGVDDTKHV